MKQLLFMFICFFPFASYADTFVTVLLSSSDHIAISETYRGLPSGEYDGADRSQIVVDSTVSAFEEDTEFTLTNPILELNYFDQKSGYHTVLNASSCLEKIDELIVHGRKNNRKNRLYLAVTFNKVDLIKHEDGIRDVIQPSVVKLNKNYIRVIRCILSNSQETALAASNLASWSDSVNE